MFVINYEYDETSIDWEPYNGNFERVAADHVEREQQKYDEKVAKSDKTYTNETRFTMTNM